MKCSLYKGEREFDPSLTPIILRYPTYNTLRWIGNHHSREIINQRTISSDLKRGVGEKTSEDAKETVRLYILLSSKFREDLLKELADVFFGDNVS